MSKRKNHNERIGETKALFCTGRLESATEVIVKLRQPPAVFSEIPLPANYFRFRVTPDLMIAVGALVKKAGELLEGQPVELEISQQSDPAEMGLTRNCCMTIPCHRAVPSKLILDRGQALPL